MQISKDIQQEMIALLYQGYSAKSVCYAISKAHKGVEIKQSDVLIIAKILLFVKYKKWAKI